MTILHPGSDEWWARWSPEQRQRTAEISVRRVRQLTVWVVVAFVGLAAALMSTIIGVPRRDYLNWQPDLIGLVGLSLEVAALMSHLLAWRQVGRVCIGVVSPKTLRGLRGLTVLSTVVGLFTGLVVIIWVGVYLLVIASDQFPTLGLVHAALVTVAVTAMASGCAALYGWVPLLSVRVTDEPDPHSTGRR